MAIETCARCGAHNDDGAKFCEACGASLAVQIQCPSCNTLNPLPAYKRQVHQSQLQAAADAGVTTLAGIYHACHRELCSHERDWPFEVVNFLELVGESMGLARPDLFKRLKLMQDADAILAEAAPLIETHHLDLDEARSVILADMLGEQPSPLPLRA